MKSIFFTVLVVLVVAVLFSATDSFAEEGAKIIYLKGNVKVQRAEEDFWILAKKGMVLKEKDKVQTFIASEAEIALDSTLKNIIRLEQNTEITLEDLKAKKLSMPKGTVLSVIESLSSGSSFEVRTPTAIAGVAGSGMSVSTDGSSTNVGCFEDKAYVQGVNVDGTLMLEIVIIEEGYKRVIGRFEMPGDLMLLTALERDQWLQFRENLRDHLDWLREKRAEGSRGAAIAIQQIERLQERFENNKDNVFEDDEQDRRDGLTPKSEPSSQGGEY
ncbi:MAG: FecR domain-containing protein [Candidatus Omnitrophica bacterium]|nr:FecR domain-containing protein [Candidatus Omnitrophota bacterium]